MPSSPFAALCPQLALALWVTIPSGDPVVVRARHNVSRLTLGPGWCNSLGVLPSLLPPLESPPFPPDAICIGSGSSSPCLRPSPWLNPFGLLFASQLACQLFETYALSRADLRQWLSPLLGKRAFGIDENDSSHFSVICSLLAPLLPECLHPAPPCLIVFLVVLQY